jgi:hypothetical protein
MIGREGRHGKTHRIRLFGQCSGNRAIRTLIAKNTSRPSRFDIFPRPENPALMSVKGISPQKVVLLLCPIPTKLRLCKRN